METDYTLVISKPDESGQVTVVSPEFPGIEEHGVASEAVSWAVDEIDKRRTHNG
jgi:hypothetical protein